MTKHELKAVAKSRQLFCRKRVYCNYQIRLGIVAYRFYYVKRFQARYVGDFRRDCAELKGLAACAYLLDDFVAQSVYYDVFISKSDDKNFCP